MKTTSVVSYALKPIVKLSGSDTLFKVWKQTGKKALTEEKDTVLREKYVEFCAKHINLFFSAVKASVPAGKWTADKAVKNRFLTTTSVNGLIICLRKMLEGGKLMDFDGYKKRLADLEKFSFEKYKSSQYTRMGQDLYDEFFA